MTRRRIIALIGAVAVMFAGLGFLLTTGGATTHQQAVQTAVPQTPPTSDPGAVVLPAYDPNGCHGSLCTAQGANPVSVSPGGTLTADGISASATGASPIAVPPALTATVPAPLAPPPAPTLTVPSSPPSMPSPTNCASALSHYSGFGDVAAIDTYCTSFHMLAAGIYALSPAGDYQNVLSVATFLADGLCHQNTSVCSALSPVIEVGGP